MMTFVILGWDAEDSKERRPDLRPAHLEYWNDWDQDGHLLLAGPMTDFAGSLFIVEAASQEEAEQKIAGDPYVKEGIFQRTEVHPFKQTLPTSSIR